MFKNLLFFVTQISARPIFIVPGLGGSILHYNQTPVWPPTVWDMITPNKVLNNIEVFYNHSGNKFYSAKPLTATAIVSFYDKLKYRFSNTHEVPYDFRLVGNTDYTNKLYASLSDSIEQEVMSKHEKSTIIAHSLGGLIIHDFLVNYCTNEWKQKYINKLITINTPYGGTMISLKSIHEKHIKYPFTNKKIKLNFVRYIGGLLWTLPNKYHLSQSKIIYQSKNKNYATSDLSDVLALLDSDETRIIFNRHFDKKIQSINKPSGVKTLVIYARGEPTLDCIDCIDKVDGDGTVTIESSTLLKIFNHHYVTFKEFNGHHVNILKCEDMLDFIQKESMIV
jgi:hypothetical protein